MHRQRVGTQRQPFASFLPHCLRGRSSCVSWFGRRAIPRRLSLALCRRMTCGMLYAVARPCVRASSLRTRWLVYTGSASHSVYLRCISRTRHNAYQRRVRRPATCSPQRMRCVVLAGRARPYSAAPLACVRYEYLVCNANNRAGCRRRLYLAAAIAPMAAFMRTDDAICGALLFPAVRQRCITPLRTPWRGSDAVLAALLVTTL